jgi:hypothetical protein
MPTQVSADRDLFGPVEGRRVAAEFDRGAITSDAGGLLLGSTDRAVGLVDRFAACFADRRAPERIELSVRTLVGQRVLAIALATKASTTSLDPLMVALPGKLASRRSDCAPLAGKSTLGSSRNQARGASALRNCFVGLLVATAMGGRVT